VTPDLCKRGYWVHIFFKIKKILRWDGGAAASARLKKNQTKKRLSTERLTLQGSRSKLRSLQQRVSSATERQGLVGCWSTQDFSQRELNCGRKMLSRFMGTLGGARPPRSKLEEQAW